MDDLSEHGQALLHPGEAGHSGGLKKAPKISAVQFGGAVANVANAAIGAGVLAFPFAFKSAGWIEGMVMSALFGVIMGSTLHVLGIATRETGKDAYQAVTQELLGKGFATAAQISMTFFCFGACCGYLDVIVDQVTPVLHQWVNPGSSILDRGWILLMFAPIVVSLCFVPRIEVLSFTSALAVLSIVYLTFVCLVQFSGDFTPAAIHEVTWFKLGASVFEAFPVICFALQCHLVFVPVTNGLLRTGGTVKTADRVALAAMLICLGLYIPTGAAGYLHFREATPSDVLTSMSDKSVLVLIARFGITATGMFSYPLLFFVGRSSLDDLLFGPRSRIAPRKRWLGLTAVLVLATYAVAMWVPKITGILDIVGSSSSVFQTFIVPAFMWIKLHEGGRKGAKTAKIIGWTLVVVGTVIGVIGTVVAVLKLVGKPLS